MSEKKYIIRYQFNYTIIDGWDYFIKMSKDDTWSVRDRNNSTIKKNDTKRI